LQTELAIYQKIIDEIDRKLGKLTPDRFLYKKLKAYRNALKKTYDVGYEIVFHIKLLS
jgi:hypothetical protein